MQWLNQYLAPASCTPEIADRILTEAGLPIEEIKPGHQGDIVLDVEVTSNRSDCLSHLGIAREIAASRVGEDRFTLVAPEIHDPAPGPPIGNELALVNGVPDLCPLFTARLIRGVTIGPSPDWLAGALESVGQRSINNVVDITNFITLELGNPCHVFDHAALAGGRLEVRAARAGERVKTLYAGEHELRETDLVVADAERPQSLAGVIGGADSQVNDTTTDIVFEMATWDPRHVRNTGRRLNIRTDAAYRFERGIDPRTIEAAGRRAVALICKVSGGTPAEGVLREGAPLPDDRVVELRPERCDRVLGVHTEPALMRELLNALSIATQDGAAGALRCTIPPHRSHDLTREIDLIEEVARARSLGVVPSRETIEVAIREPQPEELAVRAVGGALTGLGFFETVTYSFTAPEKAELFVAQGAQSVSVDDERRAQEPTLRPSVLLGLLHVRRANQDARTTEPGGIRLFEIASGFAQSAQDGSSLERRRLAMLMDVEHARATPTHDEIQRAVRLMRGAIDTLAEICSGAAARVVAEPTDPVHKGFAAGAPARLAVEDARGRTELGSFGLISDAAKRAEGLDGTYIGAELMLDDLIAPYPPLGSAQALPAFPGIERDLSLIVEESTRWDQVEALVRETDPDRCVGHGFVSVFRGDQIGAGRKSLTMRVRFRDASRTLTHDEVDPQMDQIAAAARERLGAEIRH